MTAKVRCGPATTSNACSLPSCRLRAAAASTSSRSSMGTMLTLESLRQLYARYGDTVAGRVGAVVFAAPDIDMDVFSSAINRIGPLAGKITVIAATNDRALALSGRIAGG